MWTRTLLISLCVCLLSLPILGNATDEVDFVVAVWDAGGASAVDVGGMFTKAAWDGSGDISDFMVAATGAPIVDGVQLTMTNHVGTVYFEDAGANALFEVGEVVSGTGVYIEDFNGDDITDDDWYIANRIDDNTIELVGETYVDDVGQTATVTWGGAIDGLASLIVVATDFVDASSYNCDILIKGNETLAGDLTLASGGGTLSTMLRFLGVDANWDRIVPTRAAIGAGKANGLLDTSGMPTITLNNGVEFGINQSYMQLDGLFFTGDSPSTSGMVGTTVNDIQLITNCAFKNINNTAAAHTFRSDNYVRAVNCDFIATGATNATVCFSADQHAVIAQCRFENASSSATSNAVIANQLFITNSLFYDMSGIAIIFDSSSPTESAVLNCTFENVLTCIQTPNNDDLYPYVIVGNVAKDCTTFLNNQHASDVLVLAMFNHLSAVTNSYDKTAGEIGFQDLASDPLFVDEGNDDYNLQATSDAKNSGPFLTNRGSMSDAEAGGGLGAGTTNKSGGKQ